MLETSAFARLGERRFGARNDMETTNSVSDAFPLKGRRFSSNPVISVEDVTKTYPGSAGPAVAGLSFTLNAGKVLAVLGPSGCGKTTTLRLIAGFEAPDAGKIRVGGELVASRDRWVPPEKRGLSMIFQQFALFPHLTVLQNVMYGIQGIRTGNKRRFAEAELDRVGMAEYVNRYPHQLSGGQQQRVALARALAPQPLVLLMDEPFGSLDAGLRAVMRREVKSILSNRGATAVIVTHDQEEAFSLADGVLILNEGRLEQVNTPDNIYHKPSSRFTAGFVGKADFLPVELSDGRVHSELGMFPVTGSAPEAPLELLLRPDDVDIITDRQGEGVVVEREFKGADNVYTVQLPSGGRVRSVQHSTRVFEIGHRVHVTAFPDHIVLFTRERDWFEMPVNPTPKE